MEAVLERERRLSARPGATRPDLRTRALRTDIEQRAPFPVVGGGCFTPARKIPVIAGWSASIGLPARKVIADLEQPNPGLGAAPGQHGAAFSLLHFPPPTSGDNCGHHLGTRIVPNPDTVSQPALWLVKHSDNVSGDLNFRTRRQSPGGGLGNLPNPDFLLRWSSHFYGILIV